MATGIARVVENQVLEILIVTDRIRHTVTAPACSLFGSIRQVPGRSLWAMAEKTVGNLLYLYSPIMSTAPPKGPTAFAHTATLASGTCRAPH